MGNRYKVTVLLEFYDEETATTLFAWRSLPDSRAIEHVSPTTKRAAIYVMEPAVTQTSLEWKAEQTQRFWDEARATEESLLASDDNDSNAATGDAAAD